MAPTVNADVSSRSFIFHSSLHFFPLHFPLPQQDKIGTRVPTGSHYLVLRSPPPPPPYTSPSPNHDAVFVVSNHFSCPHRRRFLGGITPTIIIGICCSTLCCVFSIVITTCSCCITSASPTRRPHHPCRQYHKINLIIDRTIISIFFPHACITSHTRSNHTLIRRTRWIVGQFGDLSSTHYCGINDCGGNCSFDCGICQSGR